MAPPQPRAPTITVMNQRASYTVCIGDLDDCAANGPRPTAPPSYGPEDGGEIELCAVCLGRVTEMLDSLLETDNWRTTPSPSSPN